jgi:hypothetical protein
MVKRKNREAGVSAVIGVILMVAIVVAIGATVVYFVMDYQSNPQGQGNATYSGWVVDDHNITVMLTNFGLYQKWSIALSNEQGGGIATNLSYLFEIQPETDNNTVIYAGPEPPTVGQHVRIICNKNSDGWLVVTRVQVIT